MEVDEDKALNRQRTPDIFAVRGVVYATRRSLMMLGVNPRTLSRLKSNANLQRFASEFKSSVQMLQHNWEKGVGVRSI